MLKKWIVLITLIFIIVCVQSAIAATKCIMNSKMGEQLSLPVYEWVDNKKPCRGIIIAVPALTYYALSWDQIARHLASKGYQVFALEMRGFGRWRTEGGSKFGANHNIDFEQTQQDLLDLINALQLTHPRQKLFVWEKVLVPL